MIQGVKEDIFSLTLKCVGDMNQSVEGRGGQCCNPTVVQVLASSSLSAQTHRLTETRYEGVNYVQYWPTMRVWRAQIGLANQKAL